MRKGIQAILVLFLVPLLLHAQEFWVKKDHQQWSGKECARLLNDSPWTKSQTISFFQIELLSPDSTMPRNLPNPRLTYVAMLWSALPIRQAAVRQGRLSSGFDKLSAPDRQTLESRQAALLAQEFPDQIVVRVTYSVNVPALAKETAIYWQARSPGQWKQDTFLITSTGRHSPVGVTVASGAGGQFELIFPRQVTGQPVVRDTDKTFALELISPALGQIPSERVFLEFQLKDMSLNGRPVF